MSLKRKRPNDTLAVAVDAGSSIVPLEPVTQTITLQLCHLVLRLNVSIMNGDDTSSTQLVSVLMLMKTLWSLRPGEGSVIETIVNSGITEWLACYERKAATSDLKDASFLSHNASGHASWVAPPSTGAGKMPGVLSSSGGGGSGNHGTTPQSTSHFVLDIIAHTNPKQGRALLDFVMDQLMTDVQKRTHFVAFRNCHGQSLLYVLLTLLCKRLSPPSLALRSMNAERMLQSESRDERLARDELIVYLASRLIQIDDVATTGLIATQESKDSPCLFSLFISVDHPVLFDLAQKLFAKVPLYISEQTSFPSLFFQSCQGMKERWITWLMAVTLPSENLNTDLTHYNFLQRKSEDRLQSTGPDTLYVFCQTHGHLQVYRWLLDTLVRLNDIRFRVSDEEMLWTLRYGSSHAQRLLLVHRTTQVIKLFHGMSDALSTKQWHVRDAHQFCQDMIGSLRNVWKEVRHSSSTDLRFSFARLYSFLHQRRVASSVLFARVIAKLFQNGGYAFRTRKHALSHRDVSPWFIPIYFECQTDDLDAATVNSALVGSSAPQPHAFYSEARVSALLGGAVGQIPIRLAALFHSVASMTDINIYEYPISTRPDCTVISQSICLTLFGNRFPSIPILVNSVSREGCDHSSGEVVRSSTDRSLSASRTAAAAVSTASAALSTSSASALGQADNVKTDAEEAFEAVMQSIISEEDDAVDGANAGMVEFTSQDEDKTIDTLPQLDFVAPQQRDSEVPVVGKTQRQMLKSGSISNFSLGHTSKLETWIVRHH